MVTCYAHRFHVADNGHMAYRHVTHMQDVLNANVYRKRTLFDNLRLP